MAEQIGASPPVTPFKYELVEGDPDNLRTVDASPIRTGPWIHPNSLKLKHRIGRGLFGDVWLATHHQSAVDFDEYHEVAVKMLSQLNEEHMQLVCSTFEESFFKIRTLKNVCWLHGISILDGKLSIAMKFYEGSIGDKIAHLKGGKLHLGDILRYGTEIAKAIMELHSIGVLALNVKPSNLLLNEHDQVILGDFGIPYLLHGIPLSNPEMVLRAGTPNYMAPEQWEPEIRGPISVETDSWSFGCSIVEMSTGSQPWFGKSIEEIYHSVVIKKEKPQIPSGLPPAIENVIKGCFEYDSRYRPLMEDIMLVFESSKGTVSNDGEWETAGSKALIPKSSSGCTSWYFFKDHIQIGDEVRSRKPLNSHKPQNVDVPVGSVVGLRDENNREGFALVKVPRIANPLRVQISTLERVKFGLSAGDWVRLKQETDKHSCCGILHSIERDGRVAVGFVGLPTLWRGNYSEIQTAQSFYVGQFVRVKQDVLSPRFEWPRKNTGMWTTGRILQVLPNGCLVVGFPGRFAFGEEPKNFLADPAEVELISFDTCPGVVEKYQHAEDFHWAVRPLAIAFGLFTAMKVGFFIGRGVSWKLKGKRNSMHGGGQSQEGQSGNAAWLPTSVANVLFREGNSTATAR